MSSGKCACYVLFIATLCALPSTAAAQAAKSEANVLCPTDFEPVPLTTFGFAKAMLDSLWYARTAVKDATSEIKQGQETDNPFSLVTASMRGTKISTNDFICAKRSVQRFVSPKTQLRSATAFQKDNIRVAARFAVVVYDAHIDINRRVLALLKKQSTKFNQVEFSDQISTLQVERGERWADLIPATAMAVMMLVDERPTDEDGNFITATDANPGQTRRLTITKEQKKMLLDWIDEHFKEFKDGTPESEWSDPAKTARLYLKLFEGRKCSDE